MRARIRWLLLGLSFAIVSGGGCSCDDEILVPVNPGTCEPTFECPVGTQYRKGECLAARCVEDGDCCPGQKCNASLGLCADQYVSCSDDEQCTAIPGQACIDFRDGQYCGYPNLGNALSAAGTQPCVTTADCDGDRTCFGRRCVSAAPCEGGCPDGQICDIDSNLCFALDTCEETCGDGEILVVSDPDTMSGPQCCLVECKCEVLPPVPRGIYGFYASIDATRDIIAVSAYDEKYGDLVVVQYDSEGREQQVDYVDGFPTTGPIVANPQGRRGGRSEPGEDVGEHTSIVVDANGVIHVAYYDRDNGRLKYANYAGGMWSTSVVDETAHVGLYSSIAIDANGNPAIAYMMVEGMQAPDPTPLTGLRYAVANTNMPASGSDWTIADVDAAEKPIPLCEGGCGNGRACVDFGMGPICATESSTCATSCGSDEVCVDDGAGTASCETELNIVPLDGFIDGVGLFADLAFTSTGTPVIAYYDRLERDLKLATGLPGGGFSLRTLDGDDAMDPTDTGQHATVAISPNDDVAVAYFDATNDDLIYYDVRSGVREIVDDGVSPPDLRMVGADASLLFDASGSPAIAYQDPTLVDLVYARRIGSPPMWSIETLRGAPPAGSDVGTAAGFYAAQARVDSNAYVCSVDIGFSEDSDLLLDLTVTVKSLQ